MAALWSEETGQDVWAVIPWGWPFESYGPINLYMDKKSADLNAAWPSSYPGRVIKVPIKKSWKEER